MEFQELDQRQRDYQREYLAFLDDEEDEGIYSQLVKNMVEDKFCRLIVNINHLRRKNPARAAGLLKNGFEELGAFQRALHEYVSSVDPSFAKKNEELYVGLEGSFGSRHVTPRSLTSRFIGNLVCAEGIVTKCSLVRPKVVRSIHYCPATRKVLERKYTDLTSFDAFPSSSVYPTADEDGNILETEFGLSSYKDHQTLTIQEMPEKAPAGQLPRSVDIICDNDLVDVCKPGDRVQVLGNYRCLPNKQGNLTSGVFRTVLIACNIILLSKETSAPSIKKEDIRLCKKLARFKGSSKDGSGAKTIFELLSQSLAPSIHGHTYVKRAILCMLLGGVEKILINGTRLRGDINILLIGDPSVAKSQLLRYVLATAPRAVPTTGRGSSGVGLTAAVTTDQETGERRLEAGAMVLADRGVVCIDEFDKMSDIDRTAIHEVMEQGRVTIAKAGIHARLNARCSVLAAANPVYGRYDQYKTPMENIGLQDSLLSRFDLLFVMLDIVDPEIDKKIADHVVRMHRYRNPMEQEGEVLPMGSTWADQLSTMNPDAENANGEVENGTAAEEGSSQVYEKYDPLLHGSSRSKLDKIICVNFMRKYIHIARCIKPTLTTEAATAIAEEYSKLRSHDAIADSDVARTQPVTVRTLETLIRLSTAHARSRLSRTVEMEDAHAAIELVQYAYFKKVLEKEKKKRKRNEDDSQDERSEGALTADTAGESDTGGAGESGTKRQKKTKRARRTQRESEGDPYDFDTGDEVEALEEAIRDGQKATPSPHKDTRSDSPSKRADASQEPTQSTSSTSSAVADSEPITDEQLAAFRSKLFHLFKNERCQSLPIARINTMAVDELSLSLGQVSMAIVRMTEQNQVMLADELGTLFEDCRTRVQDMAPQLEESLCLEEKRKELVALFKEDKWQEILSIYKRDGEKSDYDVWDCGLLWLRPSEKALNFIGENLKSLGLNKLLSIGCGSGLLEWLIQRATGIHVEGIEVDSLWWYSRYAPPCFLSKKQRHLIVVGDCLDECIPKDVALLFCYFNNEHAFQEYMSCYLGNCLIVAGPASVHDAFPSKELLEGTDVEIAKGGRHCYPRPFNIMEPWVLKAAHAVTTSPGDYIAVYTR